MDVLMIGTGSMARGIATRFLAGGHHVTLYNPDPADAEKLADELRSAASGEAPVNVAATLPEAIPGSDVVILASWYSVNLQTARDHARELDGKIVVDISNPLNDTYDGLVTEGGLSAAENIRAALPTGAQVVKAFNTTFAGTLLAGEVAGQPLDVFVAGDDEAAKATVVSLVRSGGLTAIDAGALERARQLEAIGFLGITLQSRLNTGFTTAWKLLIPEETPGTPA